MCCVDILNSVSVVSQLTLSSGKGGIDSSTRSMTSEPIEGIARYSQARCCSSRSLDVESLVRRRRVSTEHIAHSTQPTAHRTQHTARCTQYPHNKTHNVLGEDMHKVLPQRSFAAVEVIKLHESGQNDGLDASIHKPEVLVQRGILLVTATATLVTNGNPNFAQQVAGHTDGDRVAVLGLHGAKHLLCGVLVNIAVGKHHLNNPVPYCFSDMVACDKHDLKHSVYVPSPARVEAFRQDGDFHHHNILDTGFAGGKDGDELANHHFCVVLLCEEVDEVEGSFAYGDVAVFERIQDTLLVLWVGRIGGGRGKGGMGRLVWVR